jgi:hypothetical protein
MKDLHIERTLWKLKAVGQITMPAAIAFERLLQKQYNA